MNRWLYFLNQHLRISRYCKWIGQIKLHYKIYHLSQQKSSSMSPKIETKDPFQKQSTKKIIQNYWTISEPKWKNIWYECTSSSNFRILSCKSTLTKWELHKISQCTNLRSGKQCYWGGKTLNDHYFISFVALANQQKYAIPHRVFKKEWSEWNYNISKRGQTIVYLVQDILKDKIWLHMSEATVKHYNWLATASDSHSKLRFQKLCFGKKWNTRLNRIQKRGKLMSVCLWQGRSFHLPPFKIGVL